MLCAASVPSRGDESVESLGKRRAASLAVEWEVHDVNHPQLGPIKFAAPKRAVATTVGSERILSVAYVSCRKSNGTIAIELTNATKSNPAGGLRPKEMPRLLCNSPNPKGDGGMVKKDLAASWEMNSLGDTMAREMSASVLRRCASIEVQQNVALPPGLPGGSQRIAMELTPYSRALDSVFTECGEPSAYARPAEQRAPADAPVAQPEPAAATAQGAPSVEPAPASARSDPAPEPAPASARSAPTPEPAPASTRSAPSVEAPWKPARTTTKGKTNVRAAASLESTLVIQLAPGSRVLVQQASAQWWKVKPRKGSRFTGYVREDRLAFE
jgi:hypothetical protein